LVVRTRFPEDPVALHGTIDTFDLTEVIRMLAAGEKTGRLGLSGDRGSGSIWFVDGQVVASDTDSTSFATDHAAVLFQLLRFQEGSFVFDHDATSSDATDELDAEPIIGEAARRLEEWHEIEAVVPSLRHQVHLRAELPRSEVVVDRACWRAVTVVTATTTVGDLSDVLEQDELEVSRTVKTLVEIGLVEVGNELSDEDRATDTTGPTTVGATGEIGLAEAELPDPLAGDAAAGFDAGWLNEAAAGSDHVDESARDQLDALASGFGLSDEPFGVDSTPVATPPMPDVVEEVDESLDFSEPQPLDGAVEDDAGSFPIEEAEAAGEARTPLFAHDDDDTGSGPLGAGPVQAPGEAAEVARQLANLSPEAAHAVAAAARATTDEERDAALALVAEDGDEPLDPDLLRSFLSSVRQ
jgi:hypothetical protein